MLCRALASTNPGSGGLCPLGELDVPVGQLIGDVAERAATAEPIKLLVLTVSGARRRVR